jgi:hypothetical protein
MRVTLPMQRHSTVDRPVTPFGIASLICIVAPAQSGMLTGYARGGMRFHVSVC